MRVGLCVGIKGRIFEAVKNVVNRPWSEEAWEMQGQRKIKAIQTVRERKWFYESGKSTQEAVEPHATVEWF